MTSNFSGFEPDLIPANSELEKLESECFELLSAYIDGELSPIEKKQVQDWLDQDPKIKSLYTKLLSLQRQIHYSVAPPSQKSIEEITAEVFIVIDNDKNLRRNRKLVFGASAILAVSLATVAGLFSGSNSSLNIANINKSDTFSEVTMLAVAVNKPAIYIPKKALDYSFDKRRY